MALSLRTHYYVVETLQKKYYFFQSTTSLCVTGSGITKGLYFGCLFKRDIYNYKLLSGRNPLQLIKNYDAFPPFPCLHNLTNEYTNDLDFFITTFRYIYCFIV